MQTTKSNAQFVMALGFEVMRQVSKRRTIYMFGPQKLFNKETSSSDASHESQTYDDGGPCWVGNPDRFRRSEARRQLMMIANCYRRIASHRAPEVDGGMKQIKYIYMFLYAPRTSSTYYCCYLWF